MPYRRWALALLVAFGVALGLAPIGLADEGWVIKRFAADITIQPDASVSVTESIDVDFGAQRRHGIFRKLARRQGYDATHVRIYRVTLRSVTDARGRALRYDTSEEGPYLVLKIGDPEVTVSGAQSYRLAYDIVGAMNAQPSWDELYWNVNGDQWPVPTESATTTVHVAGGLERVTCYQGATGSDERCRANSTATRADFTTTRTLGSGEQLTVVTALAKGTVAVPAPILERDTENPATYFDPNPAFGAIAVFILVGGLFFLFYRWYTVGRDLRERETIVPEYEPPEALRPAQLGVLLDESADTKDVTATIVDLAVRGYLTITEEPTRGLFAKKDWTLRQTAKAAAGLQGYERIVYDGLFSIQTGGLRRLPRAEGRAEVKLSELRTKFVTSLRAAESDLYRDSADRGFFATRPDRVRQSYAGLAVLTIVAGLALAWLLGQTIGAALVGIAVATVGLVALPVAKVMPAKTAHGAELLRRTLGFRHYMEVAETERQRFAERENIFSDYLPYAIVFGCVERWARAFAGIDTSAQTASWYSGSGPFNAGVLSSSLQGFSANLGSAIAATPGSSGGSGFSGGGAGGGGGGGGGGSW